jgi:hypothetical protein
VVKINKQSAVKFIKSIVGRFEVLNRIITNNGSQFTSSVFQGYREDLGIQIFYVSIIQRVMDRLREPTLKSSRASRPDIFKLGHGGDAILLGVWG